MTVVSISLTDPVSGLSVPILPADGVAAQILDAAAPARAVLQDRVGAHGGYDVTQFLSAGAVSLTMLLYPGITQTPEKFLDAIGPLLSPSLRPTLIVTNDQWATPRQITVRFDSVSKPLSDPTNQPLQISWAAPSARWEDTSLTTASINAFIPSATGWTVNPGNTVYTYTATHASPCVFTATGSAYSNGTQIQLVSGGSPPGGFFEAADYYVTGVSGATFKLAATVGGSAINSTTTGSGSLVQPSGLTITTAGVVMPAGTSVTDRIATSAGMFPSDWQAFLYGPCTGPKFANDTTGQTLEFTDDMVLSPGDYVFLDSLTHNAFLNSDPTQPVNANLNFATSSWWEIQPGANLLRYYPSAAGSGSQAQLTFRAAWQL